MAQLKLDPTDLMRHGYKKDRDRFGDKEYLALMTSMGRGRLARHAPFKRARDAKAYSRRWLNKYSSMLKVFNPHVFETKDG